jgi:rare lipoprotein A
MVQLLRNSGPLVLALLIAGCGTFPAVETIEPKDGPPLHPVDVSAVPDAVPRVEPLSRYGNPPSYEVFNRRYYVRQDSAGYVERGIASWYGTKFHGRRTSSGEPYDMYAMTAAHKTLPLPTYAEVTNLDNGRSVIVKINDRGPFVGDRLIDLSYAAASRLGIKEAGTGRVEVRAIDPVAWQNGSGVPAGPGQRGGSTISSGYYVQIGAFSQAENASRLRTRLDGIVPHRGIHVVRSQSADSPIYRVRIGPLGDRAEADRMNRELLALGVEGAHIVTD